MSFHLGKRHVAVVRTSSIPLVEEWPNSRSLRFSNSPIILTNVLLRWVYPPIQAQQVSEPELANDIHCFEYTWVIYCVIKCTRASELSSIRIIHQVIKSSIQAHLRAAFYWSLIQRKSKSPILSYSLAVWFPFILCLVFFLLLDSQEFGHIWL